MSPSLPFDQLPAVERQRGGHLLSALVRAMSARAEPEGLFDLHADAGEEPGRPGLPQPVGVRPRRRKPPLHSLHPETTTPAAERQDQGQAPAILEAPPDPLEGVADPLEGLRLYVDIRRAVLELRGLDNPAPNVRAQLVRQPHVHKALANL